MNKFLSIILLCVVMISITMAQPTFWGTSGLLRTVSADNFGKGYLTISAHANYFQTNLTAQTLEGSGASYTQRNANGYLSAAFAPLHFLEISGGISGLLVSDKEVYGNDPTQFGFGDTYSGLKASYSPWDWVIFGGYGYVTWPTGSALLKDSLFTSQKASFAGVGLVTFDLTGGDAKFPLPLRLHLNLGYLEGHSITAIFDSNYTSTESEDDLILLRAGVEIPAGYFDLFCDFSTEQSVRNDLEFADNPIRITPGVRFNSDWFAMDFGVDVGLGNVGVQDVRHIEKMDWKVFAGISFMTRLIQEPPPLIFGKLTGSVTDADKGTPLVATVTSDDTTMTVPYVTKTDGIYRIWLTSGAHNVSFNAPGYETYIKSVVIEDSSAMAMDVKLRPLFDYGNVTGKVTDAVTGEALGGMIVFEGPNTPQFIISPITGTYSGELGIGNYTIIARVDGYQSASDVVIIEKDKTVQKDLRLMPLDVNKNGIITGNVVDKETGQGIIASVVIEDSDIRPFTSESVTGSFKRTLPAGVYDIIVSKNGYQTSTEKAIVKAGETTVVKVLLSKVSTSTITGKVTKTKDGSPLSAKISFPGTSIPTAQANENGIYNVTVKPGTYEIKAESEGFISQSFPVVAEADKSVVRDFELVKAGEKITLEGIYFDTNKSSIKPESRSTLDRAIKIMKDNPGIRVRIEGHTDSVGSDSYNQQLSQRRADSVKAYLVRQGGIDASRIVSIGRGEDEPIASNNTSEGRSMNRRIEFVVLSE